MRAITPSALLLAVFLAASAAPGPLMAQNLPKTPPSHVVLVIMENHAASQIIGSADAPYINGLASTGAHFTQSFAVTHPSQPNYLALFSGSTHQITDNRCPLTIRAENLGQQLTDAGKTFIGYSEGLPSAGFAGCTAPTGYARKHAPWVNFPDLPASTHQPMTAFPTEHFSLLPTVAIVVPNLQNDMHDGSVAEGDAWLKAHLDSYVRWSKANNALLIVTWDEDDSTQGNRIATILVGPMVKPGRYDRRITHYDVLRTLESLFNLPFAGEAASAQAITDVWQIEQPVGLDISVRHGAEKR
ncbi:MAG: alkaline phosphatase family protein [Pseudomonadota bacterium]|nr:alkaline phosphatase family protein [Pseudomonadota bacterium]